MLRITVENENGSPAIKLEGKVAGPWVDELRNSWQSLAPSLGRKKLLLDLRAVSFVDSGGRELLREIYQKNGASFLADTPLTQYFAESAMQRPTSLKDQGG